ncbi:hypothetical protein OG539_32580 [Actinacidiphila glaucinigra]|uniref:hypothetical protein n=1 Tax=Actinacidiphila glaucinigra TaxID=235986 RepID=UPI0032478620
MSLLSIARPGTGRRQAQPNPRLAAENARLRQELSELTHRHQGAGHLIESLRVQVTENQAQRDAANTKANRLQDANDRAVRLEREMALMRDELTSLRQFKANVLSTNVEPMVRDTSGEDTLTTPIPEPIYGSPTAVLPLWNSPLADTQPTPVAEPLTLRFPVTGGQVIRASGDHRATA